MTQWNALAIEALLLDPGPLFDTRAFSILHASIHDALNTTRPCDVSGQDPATASPEAAIAAAARHVLVTLSPSQAPVVQAAYEAAVAAVPEPGKSRGIDLGQDCAEATLARRDGDGSALAHTPVYVPTTAPGDYAFTPPFAFAAFPGWGRVEPFAIDLSQHALRGPDPLDSLRYALDYNIVKRVGERNSRWRTRDQTETAFFWYEGSPIGWNRIANIVLRQRGDDLWKAARVLALVNFAIADGFIAGFEAKYHFRFWRPITAIPRGAEDGNPLTAPDEEWLPLLSTP